MKIYFLIIFIITSPYILAQSLSDSEKKKIIVIETKKIVEIIKSFKSTLEKFEGKELSNKINITDSFRIEWKNLSGSKNEIFRGTIAIAAGSGNDDIIHLIIDFTNWFRLNTLEKYTTISHEICHDALNFKHTKDDLLSLMHPYSQPKNHEELGMMLARMINNYKYNLIDEFNPDEIYIHSSSLMSKTKIFNKREIGF